MLCKCNHHPHLPHLIPLLMLAFNAALACSAKSPVRRCEQTCTGSDRSLFLSEHCPSSHSQSNSHTNYGIFVEDSESNYQQDGGNPSSYHPSSVAVVALFLVIAAATFIFIFKHYYYKCKSVKAARQQRILNLLISNLQDSVHNHPLLKQLAASQSRGIQSDIQNINNQQGDLSQI